MRVIQLQESVRDITPVYSLSASFKRKRAFVNAYVLKACRAATIASWVIVKTRLSKPTKNGEDIDSS
jgi:hypothetical protein